MATIQKVSGIDFANISKFDAVLISAVGSINLIGKPVTGSLLLDTSYGSGAEAAYSVRKLRTAYTGAAMQVQATSGGATAEIGFDVNNNLDTATLLAFAGTNEVRVSIWYDQSTNGNNATQVTVANRPIVVAAGGVLVEENGRVLLKGGSTLGMIFDIPTVERYDVFSMIKAEPGINSLLLGSETVANDYFLIATLNNSSTSIKRDVTVAEYKLGGRNYIPTTRGSIYNNLSDTNGSSVNLLYCDADFTYVSTSGFRFGYLPVYADWGMYSAQEFLFYVESGSQVVTSIEENISDYYTENPAPYLLDTYTGAAAAYSLRKLRADYTGFAVKVQDNVGGATQDIGFDSFGELDTASLSNYGDQNNVFVETWYDQSGNGNNATQGTSANRPKIYDGLSRGFVVTDNGKPAVDFENATQYFTSSVNLSQPITSFSVANIDSADTYQGIFGGSDNKRGPSVRPGPVLGIYNGSVLASSTSFPTTQSLFGSLHNGVNSNAVLDGTIVVSGNAGNDGFNSLQVGGYNSGTGNGSWIGLIQEVVLYESDESTNRTGIETNLNDFYDIYTVAPTPLLLNLYPGASAGYSLRRLSNTYTGSAIKVQDNVGGATLDVGFDSYGELDTSAIVAYGGSNDVFVETWYDQSGSGNNVTQVTSANRPKIYDGTTGMVTENGKPALDFDGANDFLDSVGLSETTLTSFHVAKPDQTNSSGAFIAWDGTGGIAFFRYNSNATMRMNFNNGFNTSTNYTAAQNLVFGLFGTSLAIGYNGSTAETGGAAGTTSTGIRLGQKGNSSYFNGKAQEVVVYASDKSTDRTGIETNLNDFYDIY